MHKTYTKIMDAAETLFAQSGFHATSLRDITKHADVNLAAVNYHFGSKEDLLDAVLERRIAPINSERLRLLKQVEDGANGDTLELRAVLRALLLPPFRAMSPFGDGSGQSLRLMGRMHSETHPHLRERFILHFTSVLERFTVAFERSLPAVPLEELRWRVQFVVGAMAHTLIWGDRIGAANTDAAVLFETLLNYCEAGMRAPAGVELGLGARS